MLIMQMWVTMLPMDFSEVVSLMHEMASEEEFTPYLTVRLHGAVPVWLMGMSWKLHPEYAEKEDVLWYVWKDCCTNMYLNS